MTYEKAMQYVDGSKILTNLALIPKIEPYFFDYTGFNPYTQISVFPKSLRYLLFNNDRSLFYCAPSHHNPYFKIHKTAEIKDVEILTSDGKNDALIGAILFGTAGAIVGSGNKKSIITIRIHFKNHKCPFFDFDIMSEALPQKDRYYIEAAEIAKRVFGRLSSFIKTEDSYSQNTDLSNADQIRRYKELMDDGIITADEFETKKKQLLNL